MKTIFENGHIVLPDGVHQGTRLIVEDGKILDASYRGERPEGQVIDLQGGWLLPGFIDLHLHGGSNADFMDGSVEAFEKACYAHCCHGTTALSPTTVACSKEELFDLFDTYRQARNTGARMLGIHMEGPYISEQYRGAQPKQFVRAPETKEVDEILERASGLITRWSSAPELPGMKAFTERLRKQDICCAVAHSAATCEQILEAYDWGFCHMTHFFCGMSTIHKVNQRVHAGVIEAGYLLDDMTVELIGDGRHVPKESMQLMLKLKGADKIALITDAMRAAATTDTESFLGNPADGNRVIIEDGVAKLPDRSFYAGSIATADRMFRNAVVEYGIAPEIVSRMMSGTPARILGQAQEIGSLEQGKRADLVVMDHDFRVESVYVDGKEVFANN